MMVSDKQLRAIAFIEEWTPWSFKNYCRVRFGVFDDGFYSNPKVVSDFIGLHIEEAKDNRELSY